jgi:hypothetical protein
MIKLHAEKWSGFVLSPHESGEPQAVRWASRLKFHDPDWGKWHATDGSCTFTACGQVVRLFEVDGSPQHDELNKVNSWLWMENFALIVKASIPVSL